MVDRAAAPFSNLIDKLRSPPGPLVKILMVVLTASAGTLLLIAGLPLFLVSAMVGGGGGSHAGLLPIAMGLLLLSPLAIVGGSIAGGWASYKSGKIGLALLILLVPQSVAVGALLYIWPSLRG